MFPYEKLEVYQKAYGVNQKVYRFLQHNKSIAIYARNQFGSACLSIMLNIAEGDAKFGPRDKRHFFVTARASAFESSALINFLHSMGEVPDAFRDEIYSTLIEISKMLFTMIRNLESKI